MAKTLLRSGCLDNFLALGENGQAVFDSAYQIREALRLRKQQAVADVLAIPQPNDEGDRVDWYAPQEGRVISWAAAGDDERLTALRYLDNCQANVSALGERCRQAEKTPVRLFGALLAKTLQFPGSQYVYLVNGKPVITFWGFVSLNQGAQDDAFACLRETRVRAPEAVAAEPAEPAPVMPEPPPIIAPAPEDEPVYSVTPVAVSPAPEAAPAQKNRRLWLLPVAAAAAAVIAVPLTYYFLSVQPVDAAQTDITPLQPPAPVPIVTVKFSRLPVQPATLIIPAEPEPVAEAEPVARVVRPPANALALPAEALRVGTTKFLNGTWRAQILLESAIVGKAPSLRYQIKNNAGSVRVVHGNNIVCKAAIFSGLHQSGTLMIKTRGSARCADGSRYPLPEVSCKNDSNGATECTGRYNDDKVLPMTFTRVSH